MLIKRGRAAKNGRRPRFISRDVILKCRLHQIRRRRNLSRYIKGKCVAFHADRRSDIRFLFARNKITLADENKCRLREGNNAYILVRQWNALG